jgi:hypothetical protein
MADRERYWDDTRGGIEADVRIRWFEGLPFGEPLEVWLTTIDLPSYDVGETVIQDLVATLRLGDGLGFEPFALADRREVLSWGASGQSFSIILDLPARLLEGGVDAAATTAIGLAFRAAYHSAASRWAQEREYGGQRPVTVEEAVARARWLIVEDYGLSSDDELELIGQESRSDGGMVVRLRGDGKDYEVALSVDDGLITVVRRGWSVSP